MGIGFDSMMRNEARLFDQMSSRPNRSGDYYTGNEEFDKRVAKPWHEMRPKPREFADAYTPEEIGRDLQLVKKIKESPEYTVEHTPDAIFLEPALMEGIHNNLWLGEGVSVIPTAEYDDVVNHVDFVVSFSKEGEEPRYLAVDVTTAPDTATHEKKFEQTYQRLRRNQLTRVKYFKDEDNNPTIRGIEAPRVVLVATGDRLQRLKGGLLADRRYALDADIRQELVSEITTQLTNDVRQLLWEHFSQSVEGLHSTEDILAYIEQHRKQITSIPHLMENIEKHLVIIDCLSDLKE